MQMLYNRSISLKLKNSTKKFFSTSSSTSSISFLSSSSSSSSASSSRYSSYLIFSSLATASAYATYNIINEDKSNTDSLLDTSKISFSSLPASFSFSTLPFVSYCESPTYYSTTELAKVLKENLVKPREKLTNKYKGIQPPTLKISSVKIPLQIIPDNIKKIKLGTNYEEIIENYLKNPGYNPLNISISRDHSGTPCIESTIINLVIPISNITSKNEENLIFSSINLYNLFSNWLQILNIKSPDNFNEKLNKINKFLLDPSVNTLGLVDDNMNSSISIAKFFNNNELKLSITLAKDNHYSLTDIQKLIKGYGDGLDGDDSNNKSNLKWNSVKLERQPSILDSSTKSLDSLPGLIFKSFFGDNPQNVIETPFGNSGAGNDAPVTTNPNLPIQDQHLSLIEQLKKYDIEVYDNSPYASTDSNSSNLNSKLDWNALAGYQDIKDLINETVLLPIKYPDIYLKIASKTRENFENPFPKAILLQGPPGTGKTLTSRIISSQSESVMIVIKLESIVSKWYGDSEKKLSKILQICDQIHKLPLQGNDTPSPDGKDRGTGVIIFIDEIDSLAQNRDSTSSSGGIHEVSRRILSILLQYLEGFKGIYLFFHLFFLFNSKFSLLFFY